MNAIQALPNQAKRIKRVAPVLFDDSLSFLNSPCTDVDYAAQLAFFLQARTGSVLGIHACRMSAAQQRALFGRYLGKGRIIVDGAHETIVNRVMVAFGFDYEDRNLTHWRDL